MDEVAGLAAPPSTTPRVALTEVVVPVWNEERALEASVRRLTGFLRAEFPYPFLVTIADNGSTDGTWAIASRLAAELPDVRAVRVPASGRGRALRHVWSRSEADVVSYMDADLSIDLKAFLPLVAPLLSGHSDLAIGTRHLHGSTVVRSLRRAFFSRSYNLLLRTVMGARFSDAQCGFKAGRREVVQALLTAVDDDRWFFDTELLLIAERHDLRIHEVPVDCLDDPDSSVDVLRTAVDDLRGVARVAARIVGGALQVPLPPRLRRARLPEGMGRQLVRFAVVGTVSTLVHLLLFLGLRELLPTLAANALALVLTAVANTAANRRFTFGVRGRDGAMRHQLEGAVAFLVSLALSSGAVVLQRFLAPDATRMVELAAVFTGDALATLIRFLLLRTWVFNPRRLRGRR